MELCALSSIYTLYTERLSYTHTHTNSTNKMYIFYHISNFKSNHQGQGTCLSYLGFLRWKYWCFKIRYLSGVGMYIWMILLLTSTNLFETVHKIVFYMDIYIWLHIQIYVSIYIWLQIISISTLMTATSKRLRVGYCIDIFQGNFSSEGVLRK